MVNQHLKKQESLFQTISSTKIKMGIIIKMFTGSIINGSDQSDQSS